MLKMIKSIIKSNNKKNIAVGDEPMWA